MKHPLTRRALLGRAAAATAASVMAAPVSTASAQHRAPRDAALYVPGYYPQNGWVNGRPLRQHRRFSRHIRDWDGPARMLTRIGLDGSVRQTLLPVHAHDVDIAPDRSIGVLCGFEDKTHVAFNPDTPDIRHSRLRLPCVSTSVLMHCSIGADTVLPIQDRPAMPVHRHRPRPGLHIVQQARMRRAWH